MASPPHPLTPDNSSSLETGTDHSISFNPGAAEMSDIEIDGQPESYFQPIQDHGTQSTEYAAIITGSSSTTGAQNPAQTQVSSDGAQLILSSDASPQFPSLRTSSPVPSCLTPTHDNITSCASTSENHSSEPIVLGTQSSFLSPPGPLLPNTITVPETSSQLFSQTLSHSAESQVQLHQSTELVASSCSDQMPQDPEATSRLPNQEMAKSELSGGSPEALECHQKDKDVHVTDPKMDKSNMDSISDEKLIPGGDVLENSDISGPHSFLDGSTNPKTVVEKNVIIIGCRQPIEQWIHPSDLSFTEASLVVKPSDSKKLLPTPDVIKDNQSEPPGPTTYMSPTMPKAKSRSADYMPVLYLHVTKAVQEEAQKDSDSIMSQQPMVSSTTTRNKVRFSPLETSEHAAHTVLGSIQNDDLHIIHKEPGGHEVPGKHLKTLPVVGDRTTTDMGYPQKASSALTKSRHIISPQAVAAQQTQWTPLAMSGANYHSYYGSAFPEYGYTDPKFALHYSRAHHTWMDLKSQQPQMEFTAQFHDKNNHKGERNLKQLEQSSAEHVDNSTQRILRQTRSRESSVKTNQAKRSPYQSENYTKYYNYGEWNPPRHYSSAYYQGCYYPYNYGYKTEASKSHSQQYNTKADHYDDWWRYDPRYDATFDHDRFTQYQQSYWDQGDRQSSHSGYSTKSMSSTNSQHSRYSWHSEQSWGYPSPGYQYEVPVQSPTHSEHRGLLENQTSKEDFNATFSSDSSSAPEQFSCPHCCARFGPAGQLIQVLPNLPSEGKPALVQIHSTEVMLHGCWDIVQLQTFPGPLIKDKSHKSEVLEFIRKKYQECLQSDTLADKEASCLIWKLMEIVCKQNGKLVGTDVSHILLGHQKQPALSMKDSSDLIDFTNEALSGTLEDQTCDAESVTESDSLWTTLKDTERDIQCFRELLILGKKKDALQTAISKGLWGHAFMLANKMDNRAHSQVMSQFIDSLPESDPLRTFYQLMSGKIPLSAAHCGDKEWGDWHTHLAMILSNHTRFKNLHKKTISKMGDALASTGQSDAASFCQMLVQLDVDTQSNKSGLFILGASSSLPLPKYVTNEVIQRTELFEYALSLGSDSVCLPNFQIFKLIYACRLAEVGLCAQAFQYCEVISKALLTSESEQSLTLIIQLIQLSSKMRHFDQQMKDIPEPKWMVHLRELQCQIIEKLNSSSSGTQQDPNLILTLKKDSKSTYSATYTTLEDCVPSYKVSLLTSEMPDETSGPTELYLVPPAPQDILEITAQGFLSTSSQKQVLETGRLKSDCKAFPLSTSLISPKSSHATKLLEGDPVPAISEPQFQNLLSTSELLQDAVHLSEDQPRETKEETPPLDAAVLAPPTLLQSFPVITDATLVQSQCTDLQTQNTDLQSQPVNTVPISKSSGFAVESSALPYMSSPSSVLMALESESVPNLVAHSKESYALPSTMLPSPTSKSVPQLLSPNIGAYELPSTTSTHQITNPPIKPHTLQSTVLLSTMSLAKESQFVPQSVAPHVEPQTLYSLPSTMPLVESVSQLMPPLPFPKTLDQNMSQTNQGQQPDPLPNASIASTQMVSANDPWATDHNLHSNMVQPVLSIATTLQPPQPSYPPVSNRTSSTSFAMEPHTVLLLTVPLPASHTSPPHVEQTEFMPKQTLSLPEAPQLVPKPPQLLHSANPYAMGDKMVSSKQIHMLSKPLIPRLFVPQNPPPDPQPKKQETGGGWFSWIFGKKKEVDLPADTGKSLVWNDNLQRWVDPNEKKEKTQFTASSQDLPQTKGLLDEIPVLRPGPGPKRGSMASLNPVLMSNNPGTQHYAYASRSSTETQTVKPPNTHLTDPVKGTEHMRWTQNPQSVPYSQTSQNLNQNQKSPTAGDVPLYNPSHFCQDIL